MSGPYRFTHDSTRSPLDRRPQNLAPAQPGQPVSFKTNVNRMKTKKWVEAKKNAYDGDDWGDVDEYDEYGAEQAPYPEPALPRGYDQRYDQPSRSFTDPQRQGPPQPGRRNSFEAGDEHRAFSASLAQPPAQQPYGNQPPYENQPPYGASGQATSNIHPALRQASGTESDISDTPQHRRDFSPSAMPPPLQTRASPAPGSNTASPVSQFPPRKSSIGQSESPSALSPRERAPSNPTKPLPFIRPADIYKRVEEERQRERASLDSTRPSLDELTSPHGLQERPSSESLGRGPEAGRSLQPLETVAERRSEYLPDFTPNSQGQVRPAPQPDTSRTTSPPSLPQPEGIAAFNSDFWSSGPQQQTPATGQLPAASPPDTQGFRTVVDQAFTRSDDQRSVPPTPISKSGDSVVSRSNTASTSGISPIMSRVPSSATSALKARNQAGGDGSTPVIAEETSEMNTPVSRPGSAAMLGGIGAHQIPRKPSPSHSRNVSSSSIPRTGLATPSPHDSPARSPAIEPQKQLPEPESADVMEGGLTGPSPTYATREADIATAMKMSSDNAPPGLSEAEKQSQTAFLESHNAQSPIDEAVSGARSESPSKGRVQELAGKFGDVSHSRRGSTQSNGSRNSMQSWEKSQDNSRPSSPTKPASPSKETLGTRPAAGREVSFRPQLPGQWESYATTAATPSDHGKELGSDNGYIPEDKVSSPLEETDLTPTTARHPVSQTEPSKSSGDPLAALKAAGAAMGEALQASVGRHSSQGEEKTPDHTHGDVLPRPLQLDRTASSVSSIPPTPPAKDSPESEEIPPPPPLKERSPEPRSPSAQPASAERPMFVPQLSTATSADDQESDRLRKEIVASLSPSPNRASLSPGNAPVDRASSIFPSEYDSYWADGDRTTPRPSHDAARNSQHAHAGTEQSPVATKTAAELLPEAAMPSLLTRFSWEDHGSNLMTSDGQASGGAAPLSSKSNVPKSSEQEEKIPSPAVEQAAKEDRDRPLEGIAEPYFGPVHSIASPTAETDLKAHAPTPPPEAAEAAASPTQPEATRTISPISGLHVVNFAAHPEAVDMPPRLSREVSPISPPLTSQDTPILAHEQKSAEPPTVASPVEKSIPEPPAEAGTEAPIQEHTPKSPTTDKPLGFRDIATMKSPSERIATYNKTREYWAQADHGLNDWVASAVSANPELATQSFPPARPALATSGTTRHKATGSISLFGKHVGSSSHQVGQTTPSSSQSPMMSNSGPSYSGSGKSASHQMQTKGKDLLHTAGVLSGKGMTGAKGLFAKGKSRFKSDKASQSESSSRAASEEPEWVTTVTPRMSMETTDTTREEKKKRRFSSPFHRSSRSRSRPNSIALPSNTQVSYDTDTSKQTPSHETPSRSGSRPHSFHAPDAWNAIPDPRSPTPPNGGLEPPERLGILPSPAKSQFSLLPREQDSDVPPVPPIPAGMGEVQRGRTSHDSSRHRLLQSVIRHSTPPAMETVKSPDTHGFAEPFAPSHRWTPAHETAALRESPVLGQPPSSGQEHSHEDTVAGHDMGQTQEFNAKGQDEVPILRFDARSGTYVAPQAQQAGQDGDDEEEHALGLNHGPILSQPPFRPVSDMSAPTSASGSHAGELSPVMGEGRLTSGEHEHSPDGNIAPKRDTLLPKPQLSLGDVSPMLPPSKPAVGSPNDNPLTPAASGTGGQGDGRPAYETELIGGDVSPISSRLADDDDERTPTRATHQSSNEPAAAASGELMVRVIEPSSPQYDEATPRAAQPPPAPTAQGLSASRYQVVHAVQYVPSQSQSSFESYEQDSVIAPSHSSGSQLGDRHDDAEIPPVPQMPSLVQHEQTAAAAAGGTGLHAQEEAPAVSSTANPSAQAPPSPPGASQHGPQQSPPAEAEVEIEAEAAKPGTHKASQSLLSRISSMVSADGVSISPVSSSSHGRSRPPSAHRERHLPPAKPSPIPAQIQEEAISPQAHTSGASSNDDFDLYADHNGIVKDLRDDQGQPLRVAPAQPSGTMDAPKSQQPPPSHSQSHSQSQAQPADDDQPARYSFERPMSFISGPRDSHGRPQDQINRPGSSSREPFPASLRQTPSQVSAKPPNGAPYTASPLSKHIQEPNGHSPRQPAQSTSIAGHNGNGPSQNGQRSSTMSPPYNKVSPPPPSNASPPPQPTPPPTLANRPLLQEPGLQNGHPEPRTHDPRDPRLMQDPRLMVEARMRAMVPGQQQSPQDPRMQPQMHDQYGRMQGQPVGSPVVPRNQYEHQQQMWQRQPMDPRFHAQQQGMAAMQAPPQPAKKEEKSSRPTSKLSSVFKGLGKSHSSTPPATTTTPPAQQPGLAMQSFNQQPVPHQSGVPLAYQATPQQMHRQVPQLSTQSAQHPLPQQGPQPTVQHQVKPTLNRDNSTTPESSIRTTSVQSNVADLPSDQAAAKKERRPSTFTPLSNRPESMGGESHFSQESVKVQAADSRLDLRYPQTPAPFQGMPPQQQSVAPPAPPKTQSHRASTSGVPEKKKRFSALGALFNRSGSTNSTPTKPKMTKEEKKAQKAQKHASAQPLQSPQGQQWPPQQPFNPQYAGTQYGAPPPARFFPGMQGVPPQQFQNMSPVSPQRMYPQGMPQQAMSPMSPDRMHAQGLPPQFTQAQQGYQQYPQQQPQMQRQSQPPRQEGSAYMDTRQHAQTQQAQRQRSIGQSSQQTAQSIRSDIPSSASSLRESIQRVEPNVQTPPPGGYYKPDSKQPDLPQGVHPALSQGRNAEPRASLPPVSNILPNQGVHRADPYQQQQELQRQQQEQHQRLQQQQELQQQQRLQQYHQQQTQRQQQQPQPQHQQPPNIAQQHPAYTHNMSAPSSGANSSVSTPVAQRRVSASPGEPRYETPRIPAAYRQVSGAYVSPSSEVQPTIDEDTQSSPAHYNRQYSDPQMQPLSPQVSAMTQGRPDGRNNSNSSAVSAVSSVSSPPAGLPSGTPASNQRLQKPRMSSISEQANQEPSWKVNLPHGATEQEIVRARQRQYMEQQLAAQEQMHAERTGRSPSPRSSQPSQAASPKPAQQQQTQRPPSQSGGGFREVLPRSSPQPYPVNRASIQQAPQHQEQQPQNSSPAQPTPVRPDQVSSPASYPLPMSPDSTNVKSPVNPAVEALAPPPPPPPPKVPHSPMHPAFQTSSTPPPTLQYQGRVPSDELYEPPPPEQQPEYEEDPATDEPPPYSGPGIANDGMDKERHRPPNIITNAEYDRGRNLEPRTRQASVGMLQHPQPASMAASPQRSSADMGADILRRQLLEQEERDRQERLERAEIQRAESERERQERDRARARARELERSISGGGRVGSLRSTAGSTRTTGSGWERRGSITRPVFELPAEEDDEPVMRATSFPGQEWVPTWTDD